MKFDEFLNKQDIADKYKEMRKYFVQAQTHVELEAAKRELIAAMNNGDIQKAPTEVVEFFYHERELQFGPYIKVKDSVQKSPTPLSSEVEKALAAKLANQRQPWA